MLNAVILGAGVMVGAFSTPLADAGHAGAIAGTHLDDDIIVSLKQNGFQPIDCGLCCRRTCPSSC